MNIPRQIIVRSQSAQIRVGNIAESEEEEINDFDSLTLYLSSIFHSSRNHTVLTLFPTLLRLCLSHTRVSLEPLPFCLLTNLWIHPLWNQLYVLSTSSFLGYESTTLF